jgi:tRNA 2-thiouridine synthesizing protein A
MPPQYLDCALPCASFRRLRTHLHFDVELDTKGLLCPEPLMLARKCVRDLQPGEVLHILATDPSTHRDFSNFCRFMGHELLQADVAGAVLEFWIKKAGA